MISLILQNYIKASMIRRTQIVKPSDDINNKKIIYKITHFITFLSNKAVSLQKKFYRHRFSRPRQQNTTFPQSKLIKKPSPSGNSPNSHLKPHVPLIGPSQRTLCSRSIRSPPTANSTNSTDCQSRRSDANWRLARRLIIQTLDEEGRRRAFPGSARRL